MARAALGWSLDDLAEKSGIGRRTIARFEAGEVVQPGTIEKLRATLEAGKVRFLMNGPHKGAVVPPPLPPVEDRSGGNPMLPKG